MTARSATLIRPRDLLDRILTCEGWRCIVTRREGRFHHAWFSDNEKAEDCALREDQAIVVWVYHACALYRTAGSRKRENVWKIQCYWLDIDVGPGKGYPDISSAWQALCLFRSRLRLPDPLVVASGSGIFAQHRRTIG